MRRSIGFAWLPAVMAFSLPAAAQQATSESVRFRIEGLLMAYDQVPAPEAFTALGAEGRDVLLAIAADVQAAPFLRGRAAAALMHFPEEVVRKALERLLSEPDLSDMILRRVLGSLAVFGEREVSVVAPYLEDGRLEVREAAARSLATIGGSAALRVLRRRIEREPDDALKSWLRYEADRLERANRGGD